jgi:thiopurine S-methyltransferase
MKTDFWLDTWAKHQIGFHRSAFNEHLVAHWPTLQVQPGATVLVPLCGKTLDMRWLRERGHPVLGIELARTACVEFFDEWDVAPSVTQRGPFEVFDANGVTLLCGDFFALQAQDVEAVGAVYDRAALVALPLEMRRAYLLKLRELLPTRTPTLLVTFDYSQQEMAGPPFAVSETEVHSLYAGRTVEKLADVDITDVPDNARFRQRGATRLRECVFRIGEYESRTG